MSEQEKKNPSSSKNAENMQAKVSPPPRHRNAASQTIETPKAAAQNHERLADAGVQAQQSGLSAETKEAFGMNDFPQIDALKTADQIVGTASPEVTDFFAPANAIPLKSIEAEQDPKKAETTENSELEESQAELENEEAQIAEEKQEEVQKETELSEENAEIAQKETEENAEKTEEQAEQLEQKAEEEAQNAEAEQKAAVAAKHAAIAETPVKEETPKNIQPPQPPQEVAAVAAVPMPVEAAGGAAAGAGMAMPQIGGGAPTVAAPKGVGEGKHEAEKFANAGASYQLMSYGELGALSENDTKKGLEEINASTPGVEGGVINDGQKDALMASENAAKKQAAAAAREARKFEPELPTIDTLASEHAIGAMKDKISAANSEKAPNKPNVEVDTSAITKTQAESTAKYNEATTQAQTIASSAGTELQARGFDDMQIVKVEIEDAAPIQTESLASAAGLEGIDNEAMALFDQSEEGKNMNAQLQAASAKVDNAETERKAAAEKEIENYTKSTEETKAKAAAEEEQLLADKKLEMDTQIDEQSREYQNELEKSNSDQQSELDAANQEIDTEKAKAKQDLDKEYRKNEKETKNINDEGEKKKESKSFIGKAASWIKSKVDAVASWVKTKLKEAINALKSMVCKILDGLVAVVSRINKDLGAKLKKHVDKLKDVLDRMAKKLCEIVDKIVDSVAEAIKAKVDEVADTLQKYADGLKAALSGLWEACKGVWNAVLTGDFKAILEAVGDCFFAILKSACALLGIDGAFLDNMRPVAKAIIDNPGRFFVTMGQGFVGGFKQFGANIGENVKAIFKNLINMWLGTVGLELPGEFSLGSVIQFGLDVCGINVSSILAKLGIDLAQVNSIEDIKEAYGDSPVAKFIADVKARGIVAVIDYLKDYMADLAKFVMEETISAIVQRAATAAIEKLVLLSNPVSGLIAALKAVWDLIQFVRQNMSAIAGLVSALTETFAQAANGDPSGVANGVEAALCRLIPLAIDLLLRLAGINVGAQVQKVVTKLREKVGDVVNKFIGKFDVKQKVGSAIHSSINPPKKEENKDENKAGEKKAGTADAKKSEPKTGLEKFNQSAQKFADKTNAWTKANGGFADSLNSASKVINEFNKAEKEGDAFGLEADDIEEGIDKHKAWKRYQKRKAKEGKEPMEYSQWSKNFDNLKKARAAKAAKAAEKQNA